MQTLTIESVALSKTGKSQRIKASNGVYFGADKTMQLHKGMTIDAEIEDGDFGPWIKGFIAKANPSPVLQHPETGEIAKLMQAPYWQPFSSNVVACAINTGLIKEPSQIQAWVDAVEKVMTKGSV